MSKTAIRYLALRALFAAVFAGTIYQQVAAAGSRPYGAWLAALGATVVLGSVLYWIVVWFRFGIAGINERAEAGWQPVEYNPRSYWIAVAIVSVVGVALAAFLQWGR